MPFSPLLSLWPHHRCIVPRSGPDAFLFVALAIIAACLLSYARLSSVLVLLAGAAAEAAVFSTNLGRREGQDKPLPSMLRLRLRLAQSH